MAIADVIDGQGRANGSTGTVGKMTEAQPRCGCVCTVAAD